MSATISGNMPGAGHTGVNNEQASHSQVLQETCPSSAHQHSSEHSQNEVGTFQTHQSAAPSLLEEIKGMGRPTGSREPSTGTSGSALLLQFKVKHLLCTHS